MVVKRDSIRALVLYSRSGFFFVDGRPEGIYYETLQYFERFVNQRLPAGQHMQVTFIPVRPDQLEAALTQGVGDLVAYGLVVTAEREQQVAFSTPIQTEVKQIVATRKEFGPTERVPCQSPSTPPLDDEAGAGVHCGTVRVPAGPDESAEINALISHRTTASFERKTK